MDAVVPRLLGKDPGPHLLGDVGQHGGKQAQQHAQPQAQRRHRRAPAHRVGLVPRPHLGDLEIGVGEVVPEEALGLLERLGVVETLERIRRALHELPEPRQERPIELGAHRVDLRRLREHELRGVEDLRLKPLADLEHLLVAGRVGAEPRARRPVAQAVRGEALEQRHGHDHVALGLGHLLAVRVEHPARDHGVPPRNLVLVQQRLRDRVERPGPDDLVALGAHVRREELRMAIRVELPPGADLGRERAREPGVEDVFLALEASGAIPLAFVVAGRRSRSSDPPAAGRATRGWGRRGRGCRRRRGGTRPGSARRSSAAGSRTSRARGSRSSRDSESP